MKPKTQISMKLDFRLGLPAHAQIVQQIQKQISAGILKPDEQLPTVRELANELGVNFNTVARAYRSLDRLNLISTQHGRGTYISANPSKKVLNHIHQKSLEELTRHYVERALQLGYSKQEIKKIFNDQLLVVEKI